MPARPLIRIERATLNSPDGDAHSAPARELTTRLETHIADAHAGWNGPATADGVTVRLRDLEAAIATELVALARLLGAADTIESAVRSSQSGERCRLILSCNHAAIEALPWELYLVPDVSRVPLGEEPSLALVRCRERATAVHAGPAVHSVTFVGLHGASATDEAVHVQGLVDAVPGSLEVVGKPSRQDVLYALSAGSVGNVVHLVGHGVKRKTASSDSIPVEVKLNPTGVVVWVRQQNTDVKRGFPINLLNGRFGAEQSLSALVLDMCYSQLDAPGVANAGNRTALAKNVAQSGVPVVVGFAGEITHGQRLPFAKAFYDALARGEPVDFAVQAGRSAVSRSSAPYVYRGPDRGWRAQVWVTSPSVLAEVARGHEPAPTHVDLELQPGAAALPPFDFGGPASPIPAEDTNQSWGAWLTKVLHWPGAPGKGFGPPPAAFENDTGAMNIVWVPASLDRQPVDGTPFDLQARVAFRDRAYRLGTAPFVALRRRPERSLQPARPRAGPISVRVTTLGSVARSRLDAVRQSLVDGWAAAAPEGGSAPGPMVPPAVVFGAQGGGHAVHADVDPKGVSDDQVAQWVAAQRDQNGSVPALVTLSGSTGQVVCDVARRLSAVMPCVVAMQCSGADTLLGALYFRLANGKTADDAIRDTRWVATCEVEVGCLRTLCESSGATTGTLPARWVFPILFGDGSARLVPAGTRAPESVPDPRPLPAAVRDDWAALFRAWRPEAHVVPLSVLIDHLGAATAEDGRRASGSVAALVDRLPAVDLSGLFGRSEGAAELPRESRTTSAPDGATPLEEATAADVSPSVTELLEARRTLRGARAWAQVATVEFALAARLPAPWMALLLRQTMRAPDVHDAGGALGDAKAQASLLLAKFDLDEGRIDAGEARLAGAAKRLESREGDMGSVLLAAALRGLAVAADVRAAGGSGQDDSAPP